MNLETYERGSICVIKPQERRLDARVAVPFKEHLVGLVAQGRRKFLVDLQNVDFVDSSGLGAVLACVKRVGREGDVRLSSVRPAVLSLIELTRLDKILTIYGSEEEALLQYR